MTRKKVKLAFIANDSARKATFKKRKKGLMKKVNELSTLCGIEACAIIYSPYESQPEVWPSPMEARQVAAKFKGLPEMEQSKKMVNQESYLRQRILKACEQLMKQRKDNREKDITLVMFQSMTGKSFHNLSVADFSDLEWVIDQNLKEIGHRIETLKKLPATTQKHPNINVGGSNVGDHQVPRGPVGHPGHDADLEAVMERQQQQQQPPQGWFMDLINSEEDGHGGLGVGGALGDEMMLPFGDTNNNIHINGGCPHWSGAFFP